MKENDRPRTCPDCGTLLKPFNEECWDNGHLTRHPALWCEKCNWSYYREILDLPIRHKAQKQEQPRVHVS